MHGATGYLGSGGYGQLICQWLPEHPPWSELQAEGQRHPASWERLLTAAVAPAAGRKPAPRFPSPLKPKGTATSFSEEQARFSYKVHHIFSLPWNQEGKDMPRVFLFLSGQAK